MRKLESLILILLITLTVQIQVTTTINLTPTFESLPLFPLSDMNGGETITLYFNLPRVNLNDLSKEKI
jgi:hypothetical protein